MPVKDIVHTMHQFKHEHHLHTAHTLEGAHTNYPVVAYSLVCTSVVSRDTEIENYKVTQADRQTHTSNNNCSVLRYAVTLNRMKLT